MNQQKLIIEVLVFDGCPQLEAALALAEDVAQRLGPAIEVLRVDVDTPEKAAEIGFLGSPSFRVDGVDIEARSTPSGTLCCRLYDAEAMPPTWLLEAAVLSARQPRGILFLCVANSARSQLGEALARHLLPPEIEVFSAGSAPTQVRPEAITVLAELGLEVTEQHSKHVSTIDPSLVDTVITLCAEEECPVFLGKALRIHWGLPDPASSSPISPEESLSRFRSTRDELQRRILKLRRNPMTQSPDQTRAAVREQYGKVARAESSGCCSSGCCGPNPLASLELGYTHADLAAVPEGANLGLGCGNPGAIAALKTGEVVLDLGAGAGFDAFLAARQVGPTGRVIGVDMTPDMLSKARENAAASGLSNVDFRLGEIEHLPVADQSIDVIISNCVINLSPDKAAVFADAYRVLKPGGRLAISDVVALRPMPDALRRDVAALTGCIAGASLIDELREQMAAVGFTDIRIEVEPQSAAFIADWLPGSGAEQYVASAKLSAVKQV